MVGIRQIEIDVFSHPSGGLFGTAAALKLAGENGTLSSPEYRQSGWKVTGPRTTLTYMR